MILPEADVPLSSLEWQDVTCFREMVWWEGWEEWPPSLPLSGRGFVCHLWSRWETGLHHVNLAVSLHPGGELEDPNCTSSPSPLKISVADLVGSAIGLHLSICVSCLGISGALCPALCRINHRNGKYCL